MKPARPTAAASFITEEKQLKTKMKPARPIAAASFITDEKTIKQDNEKNISISFCCYTWFSSL